MIKVNTLLDLIEIDTFISQWENSDKGLMALRNLILDSNSYILSSRDKSCYILIEVLYIAIPVKREEGNH